MNNKNHKELTNLSLTSSSQRVNWVQVGTFLLVTFGLTWGLDLALALMNGLTNPAISLALQLQMLIPAASAIILGLFFFKDSPLYYQTNRTVSRWFVYYYLLLTFLYTAGTVFSFFNATYVQTISSILLGINFLGLILLIVLRIIGKYDSFASINMSGGKPLVWLIFGLGVVLFFALQTALNWLFKLGTPVDLIKLFPQLEIQTLPITTILLSMALNTVLIGPFLGLIISFGEEYGWRGYLQSALIPLGKIKGVLLVGIIWGIWHWPVILMGYNYPGHPILGSALMVLFTIALAFILAYSVFKGKGLWIAAFLHALNNQTLSFCNGFIYAPNDKILAFGIGIFGIICFGIVVFFILKDPVWKEQ